MRSGNRVGERGFAGSGAADEDRVAVVGNEAAIGEFPNQPLGDRRVGGVELVDVLCQRQFGDKIAEIRRWHVQERGWRDIGYHWVIDRDGSVAPGRSETEIGAHVEGHNRGTIGICLLGGYGASADDPFEKSFTPAQAAAVRRLINEINARAAIRKVSGHNDYAAKACPGFGVATWLRGPR